MLLPATRGVECQHTTMTQFVLLSLRVLVLLLAVVVLFTTLHAQTDLYSAENVSTILTVVGLLVFPATGAAVVIASGGIDISIGHLMILCAGVAGVLWNAGEPAPVACAAAIVVGTLGGVLNASLSLLCRIHPIIVTLATAAVYYQLAQWVIGETIIIPDEVRRWYFSTEFGVPTAIILGLAVIAAAWLLLRWSPAGRAIDAAGCDVGARLALDSPRRFGRTWFWAFGLQGALVGAAGFLALNYAGRLEATSFGSMTLEALTAAFVGGAAIKGGRGSVFGVLLACLLLAALRRACLAFGIPLDWQWAVVGGLMAVAVTVDSVSRRLVRS